MDVLTAGVRDLRMIAGYSQERAADLAGVSVRTWRRWERGDNPPALVLRWLRYECGAMPGWPAGFRRRPEGIECPTGDVIPPNLIEGARWMLQQLQRPERDAVWQNHLSHLDEQPAPGAVVPFSVPRK